MSSTPEFVADQIVKGVLANKQLIGCPKFEFFLLAAIKKYIFYQFNFDKKDFSFFKIFKA